MSGALSSSPEPVLAGRAQRTVGWATAAAALLVLASGLVTVIARHDAASGRDRGEAANRTRSRTEMTRLVGLVRLPASAAPTRDRPDALSAPEEEPAAIPGTLVDVTRFVFVGLPLADAQTYIQAHPPALPYTNSGPAQTLDRTGISSVGYSYGEPDSAAWSDASLEITVAPAGAHSSVWRIDGYAFVVDPSPLRVQAVMPGFRLTGGGGCPAVDNHGTVQNPGLDLGRELLPGGAPRAGLLCHYDAHGVLSEQSRLAAPAALTFASEVRGSVYPTPMDRGKAAGSPPPTFAR